MTRSVLHSRANARFRAAAPLVDFEIKLQNWCNLQSSQDQVGDVATFRVSGRHRGHDQHRRRSPRQHRHDQSARSAAASWEAADCPSRFASAMPAANRRRSFRWSKPIPTRFARPPTLLDAVFFGRRRAAPQAARRPVRLDAVSGRPVGQAAPARPGGGATGCRTARRWTAHRWAARRGPGVETTAQALTPGSPNIASMEAIARINNVQDRDSEDVIVVRGRTRRCRSRAANH